MNDQDAGRRAAMRRLAAALQALLALPLLARTAPARAGTGRKEEFHYQDHPNEGKRCMDCVQFVPPPPGQDAGTCQIVAGPISPNGWCMAFTPK